MIDEHIKGKRYKSLIDLLQKQCNRFAFVVDERFTLRDESIARIKHLTDSLEHHLIEIRKQKGWETTSLADGVADVYYVKFNNVTSDFLKETSDALFDWLYPELPEDLMFYQNDTCLLAVCSHERYFLVDEGMWRGFKLL